ncbi:hypothetical protein HYFRA_00001235 [Hymenoscyphus fraxineus]|uniref:Uncharacterized protein n=1 Tax=Hymenoscyphus fraxineus TaxID=746836 RepID=A0A9N9KT55_9HELO|nr:hypothetical protein HYFRA_00001235 [Hymenoscyphus fraxineus]
MVAHMQMLCTVAPFDLRKATKALRRGHGRAMWTIRKGEAEKRWQRSMGELFEDEEEDRRLLSSGRRRWPRLLALVRSIEAKKRNPDGYAKVM